jgi:hypothetical protein
MTTESRTRLLATLIIATVIPIGLFARSYRSGAASETFLGFFTTYSGDTLWPIMLYFIGRFIFPRASCGALFATVLAIALTLEFGQLWKPPILQWLRAQPITGFVLGNHFIWSDIVCCTIGAVLALLADSIFFAKPARDAGVV